MKLIKKVGFTVALLIALFVFVRSNCNSAQTNFKELTFSSGACYGTCPIYKMTVHKDGSAIYSPILFNKQEKGIYEGQLSKQQLSQLEDLLVKANISNLKDSYEAQVTDLPTYNLVLTFQDDRQKPIRDYGAMGPQELVAVYHYIRDLRDQVEWEKTEDSE